MNNNRKHKLNSNAPAGGESNHASTVRSRRLMKELKEIQRQQESDPMFKVELVDDNLFEWHVHLYKIDKDSALAKDMRELKIPHILLQLKFPANYPFAPPFMRVIEPIIEGGYVIEGGAICMDLLTPSGWASVYTAESVVMQFAVTVVRGRGRISRKPFNRRRYTQKNAESSFYSAIRRHGWDKPQHSKN